MSRPIAICLAAWIALAAVPAHLSAKSARLPEAQIAAIARDVLDQITSIHAFPPVTNALSNALCRKGGFELVEEADFVYPGRAPRCNHWSLDVT
jgi:hypothetical protein